MIMTKEVFVREAVVVVPEGSVGCKAESHLHLRDSGIVWVSG